MKAIFSAILALLGGMFAAGVSSAQETRGTLIFEGCNPYLRGSELSGSEFIFTFETNSKTLIKLTFEAKVRRPDGSTFFNLVRGLEARAGHPGLVKFGTRSNCDDYADIIITQLYFPGSYRFGPDLRLKSLSADCPVDYCVRPTW
jgi:hypothetical protein